MIVAISFAAAAVVASQMWLALRTPLSNPSLLRTNFRGNEIPAIAGVIVLIVATIGSLIVLALSSSVDSAVAFAGFQAAAGFGVLGMLDDLGADSSGGGFGGHLRALRNGKVTTGLVKLIGGGVVAAMTAGIISPDLAGWVRDTLVIALSANLANLFDRAPGRTTKVAVIAFVALAASTALAPEVSIAALAVGAAVGLAPFELGEHLMQGDTGVNVVGALLAVSAVATCPDVALWIVLAVVLALNLISERVSFSKVIAANRVLRAIDMAGRAV
ncbi:MAG: hypothetical protein R2770_20960 [Acidimicrobiales bacterium]